MMRILLDGEYFAMGESLEDIAELSELPVERFSFHVDDLRPVVARRLREAASAELRAGTRANTNEEAISAAVTRFYETWKRGRGAGPPAELEALAGIQAKLEAKLREVATAETVEELEGIGWEDG